ncbi:MAG: ABC transporter permease [Gemmatimonadota bacterium]
MRDWRNEIRRRLADAQLSAAQEAEIVEELAQHLEDRFQELIKRGSKEADAGRIVLGELEADNLGRTLREVKPRVNAADPMGGDGRDGLLYGVWQDVRYAVRTLRLSPAFTGAAVLALGLGVGAATAVFSLLNGVVLRPLSYDQPDRLVMVWEKDNEKVLSRQPVSPVNVMDYRRLRSAFEDVAAWWKPEINLVDGAGEPIRVSTVETSENLFQVLGVSPVLGRGFQIDSTLHGTESEAVISHRLWQSRFGGDRSVIGRAVRLNGSDFTIVGVMPPSFQFPDQTDLWQRLQWDLAQHSRHAHFMQAVARLRPGITAELANRELTALSVRLGKEFPPSNRNRGAHAVVLGEDVAGVFRPGLFALLGAAGLLLLIACINVANLLLARSAARQTEIAVRATLGATRARLVRQFLFESLVLAGAGTLLGLVVAIAGVQAVLRWSPIDIPRAGDIAVSGVVLLFTALATVATAIVFGVAPALLASRANLQSTLKQMTRGTTSGNARARSVLVVAEVALAVALLAGAGLLIRSVNALLDEDSGVEAAQVVSVDVALPEADYGSWQNPQLWPRAEQFYSTLLTRLRARPEITSAGASNFLPLEAGWRVRFRLPGDVPAQPGEETLAQYHTVDDAYFKTIGVRLLGGRHFDERDRADAPGVVIVNQAFARQFFPGSNAVGKQVIALANNVGPLGVRLVRENLHEVIGVVADVKNTSLKAEAEPAIYSTVRQFPFLKMYIVGRGQVDAATLVELIRTEVQRIDPNLPLGEVRTLERVLAASADPPRFIMLIMTVFAGLALLLSAIGIYGILSYNVNQRSRELGVRLALGARPLDVLALVVREGVGLSLAGAALGVLAALAGSRWLSGLLYGVQPNDPLTLVVVVTLVLLVALIACVAPGRRAALSDPAHTFRSG